MTQTTDEPTSVYRYYDQHGVLIYVGITGRSVNRNLQHSKAAPFWPHVVRQEVEHLPDRGAALAREKELIKRHLPPFNTQHNPQHAVMRSAYETVIAQPHPFVTATDMWRTNKTIDLTFIDHQSTSPNDGQLLLRTKLEHEVLARALDPKAEKGQIYSPQRTLGNILKIEPPNEDCPFAYIRCITKHAFVKETVTGYHARLKSASGKVDSFRINAIMADVRGVRF